MVSGVLKMNEMLKTAGAAVLGAGLLLAGCVPTETQVPVQTPASVANAPLPPADIMAEATIALLAQAIAAECPSGIDYNLNHADQIKSGFKRTYSQYANSDAAPDWASDASIKRVHQEFDSRDLPNYMARRHVKQGDSASWCAAGKAEIAGKTAIGKYLIAR